MKDYSLKGIYSSARDHIDMDITVKAVSLSMNGVYKPFIYTLHCHDVKIFKTNKDTLRVYYYDDISYVKRHIPTYKVQEVRIIEINNLTYHGSQPDIEKMDFEVVYDE